MSDRSRAEEGAAGSPSGTELVGATLPAGVVLPSVRDTLDFGAQKVNVAELAAGMLVVYCFADSAAEQSEDRGLTAAFASCYMEFRAVGARVAGLSAEPLETLEEAAVRGAVPFRLISDQELVLAERLGLPCDRTASPASYERLILIAQEGLVAWVHSPDRGARHALDLALSWVQESAGCSHASRVARLPTAPVRTTREPHRHPDARVLPPDGARRTLRQIRDEHRALAQLARAGEESLERLLCKHEPDDARLPASLITPTMLDNLIVWYWSQTLRDPFDWARWPLAHYSFAERFIDAVRSQSIEGLAGAAWVCAMVASNLVERLTHSLSAIPLTKGDATPGRWRCDVSAAAMTPQPASIEYTRNAAAGIMFEVLQPRK